MWRGLRAERTLNVKRNGLVLSVMVAGTRCCSGQGHVWSVESDAGGAGQSQCPSLAPADAEAETPDSEMTGPHMLGKVAPSLPWRFREESITERLRGRPVLVNFWGTCAPRAEMPWFEEFPKYGPGFEILGLTDDADAATSNAKVVEQATIRSADRRKVQRPMAA